MPKCLKCNKIIGPERVIHIYKTTADGECSLVENVHYYQCFKCRYPKNGMWTKTREDLSTTLGKFLFEVKKSNRFSATTKFQVETECLRIQRMPGLFFNQIQQDNLETIRTAIYSLMDQIELY